MHRIDGAGHDNYSWVAEDPATNRPPTEITAAFMNAVQEEIAHVVEGAGIPLNKADNTQLRQAIAALIAAAVTVVADATDTVKGILKLATNGLTQEGVDDTTAVTPASLSSCTATEVRTGLAKVATQAIVDAGANDTDFITPNKLKNTTLLGLGYGQTWRDVTASRSANTTYTNSLNKPIQIHVIFAQTGQNQSATFTAVINGVSFNTNTVSCNNAIVNIPITFSLIIPAGHTYRINATGSYALRDWAELR